MHASRRRLAQCYRLLRNSWRAFVRFCDVSAVTQYLEITGYTQYAGQSTSGSGLCEMQSPKGLPAPRLPSSLAQLVACLPL